MRTIGHEDVWSRLDVAYASDRLAHALLFTGPPGIGKSLFAVDFAARVVCESESPPCGDCAPCRQLAAGSNPNVSIVRTAPGKKEIGVDLARGVKHFVQLRGIGGRPRVVVIEEADRLSIAAQNAMLKTLEEPPGHSILILVTDSPGALLSTVRSRCQRISFRPLTDDQIREVLRARQIAQSEIDELVPLAHGSPGRALELRDVLEGGEVGRLEESLAALRPGSYGPVVDFVRALGRSEQEMTSRLALLEESLHKRLVDSIGEGAGSERTLSLLRALDVTSESRALLRRRNPNRPLLAEATAIKLARTGVALQDFES
jgi:DNA polymerase-3 subunit delta'